MGAGTEDGAGIGGHRVRGLLGRLHHLFVLPAGTSRSGARGQRPSKPPSGIVMRGALWRMSSPSKTLRRPRNEALAPAFHHCEQAAAMRSPSVTRLAVYLRGEAKWMQCQRMMKFASSRIDSGKRAVAPTAPLRSTGNAPKRSWSDIGRPAPNAPRHRRPAIN